jgi:putative chitinase
MPIDRQKFFNYIKSEEAEVLFERHMTALQVAGLSVILDVWESPACDMKNIHFLAYMLATAHHETARTMQPIEEYGKGRGRPYGHPNPVTGATYYGRGYVQLTWDYNYHKMDKLLGLGDALYMHPDKALEPPIAAKIMFEGMELGSFTGRKLADYAVLGAHGGSFNYVQARKIINGMDKASLIATYARQYEFALKAS